MSVATIQNLIVQPRRKHYVVEPRRAVHVTDRVEKIKHWLNTYRLLRSTHIVELLRCEYGESVSHQRTLRLLRALHDSGDLLRIRNDPHSARVIHGSLPKIYGLNDRKNQALNERRITAGLITPHTLSVASTMVYNVIRPCSKSYNLKFVSQSDIIDSMPREQRRRGIKLLSWRIEVPYTNKGKVERKEIGITPDQIFLIEGGQGRDAFLLEEDLGTEPINAKDIQKASIYRKVLAYAFTHSKKILKDRLGMPGFRVLFVTNSKERVFNMISTFDDVNEELKKSSLKKCTKNTFLFIDRETLRTNGIFNTTWLNAKGEEYLITSPQ